MSDEPIVLEYAAPAQRRPIRAFVTPQRLAFAGAVVAFLTLLTPYDIGSGRVIVNPLRVLGCGLAVLCALAYALMRLWQDRRGGSLRALLYAVCLVGSIGAFAYGHLSVWGRTRLPRMSLRHEYWRSMLAASVLVGVALTFGALRALHRWWRGRAGPRPAS